MLCLDPFIKAGQAFPCGKCLPCIKRRRQLWTHRIMLESLLYSDNAIVTLTYADDMLPENGSLQPADLSSFMKRLRARVFPRKIRFYGVGEYGDQSERPHYHVVLFNHPTCVRGRSFYTATRTSCCSVCDSVRDTWGFGNVLLDKVTTEAAGYICGYITKNMRRTDDARLNGRWPEFARMSLHPGLGFGALDELTQVWMQYGLDESRPDVPTQLRHGGQLKPLGRYLRGKARKMMYGEDAKAVMEDTELQALWESACAATPKGGEIRRNYFKNLVIQWSEPRVHQMEVRGKIKRSRLGERI